MHNEGVEVWMEMGGERAIAEITSPHVDLLKRHETHNQIKGRHQSGLPYPSIPASLHATPPSHTVKEE